MKSFFNYRIFYIIFFFIFLIQGKIFSDELFVFAGNDTTICLTTDSIEVFGYAENYHYVAWNHTGDGFFYNATNLKTAYIPGSQDIVNQHVTLYLVGISNQPWYWRLVDSINIAIVQPPVAYAGMDATICEGQGYQLYGAACQCQQFYWETSGDGFFSENQIVNPYYTPGPQDIINGEVTLTITALENSPCLQPYFDPMDLNISKAPFLSAGSNALICQGSEFQLDAQAENYTNIYWGSSGDGTFCNNAITNPVYFPGSDDIENGFVHLIVLITPYQSCGLYLVDSLMLTVQKRPVVETGPNQTVCETEIIYCNGFADNYQDILWMVYGGNGYFDDPDALNTFYHLGEHEKSTGIIYLTILAMPEEPCVMPVNAVFQVDIVGEPDIMAGENLTFCTAEPIYIQGFGENLLSPQWKSLGDGTFDNDSALSTHYHPGNSDLLQPNTLLWLDAGGNAPCSIMVSDTMVIANGIIQNTVSNIQNLELFLNDDLLLYFEVQQGGNHSYQWFLNQNPLDNITGPQLIINEVSPQEAGYYYCIFENDCFQISSDTALITIIEETQQEILLFEGWNGVSSFIEPENCNIEVLLNPVIDDIVILFNEEGVFSPNMDLYTIVEWKSQTGYITKTTSNDILIISGYIKYPKKPVAIPSGWSLFSTGDSNDVNVENFLSGYPDITIIKEIGGLGIYWPEKNIINLETLKPGKAYHIFNANPDTLTIPFPEYFY
jgi:hypothetical protein